MGLLNIARAVLPVSVRQWPHKSFNMLAKAWYRLFSGANRNRAATFGDIYARKQWGEETHDDYFSGPGSTQEYTAEYEKYVAEYIKRHDIATVLDIGCGDFQVAGRILNSIGRPINYIGIDVADNVIARNTRLFSSDHVAFRHLDAVEAELPDAELVLIREVLQHLSVDSINRILRKLRRFKHVLITEHCSAHPKKMNIDIPDGKYARVDFHSGTYLDREPFNIQGTEVLNIKLSDQATCIRSFLITRE